MALQYVLLETGTDAIVLEDGAGGLLQEEFTPASLGTRLKWWYRAAALNLADGSAVASWTDSSGNASAAANATTTAQPAYIANQLNGKPVVRFATDDALQTGAIDLSAVQKMSIFTVYKQTAATGGMVYEYSSNYNNLNQFHLFAKADYLQEGGSRAGGLYSVYGTGQTYNTAFKCNRVDFDLTAAPNARIYTNNALDSPATVLEQNGTGAFFGSYPLYIGARAASTSFANMDLAEMFAVINPTAQDIIDCQNYLNSEYALY